MQLDYRKASDMALLADRLRNTSVPPVWLAVAISDQGLMVVSPWWVCLLLWITKWRRGTSYAAWVEIEKMAPGTVAEFIDRTVAWITSGRDVWTADAAGGFSGEEVAILARSLDFLEEHV